MEEFLYFSSVDSDPAGYFIPDERVATHELLEPGRKPTLPIEIDWTNPISQGLKHCVVQNEDLISNARGLSSSPAVYETGFFQNNDSDGFHLFLSPIISPIQSTPLTTMIRYESPDSSGDNVLFGNFAYVNASLNVGWGIRKVGADLELVTGQNLFTRARWTDVLLPFNEMRTYAGVYDAVGANRKLYVDGVDQGSPDTSANTGGPGLTSVSIGLFSNDGGGYFAGTAHAQGKIEFAYAWDRELTEQEIVSLSRDPYQILRPAYGLESMFLLTPPAPGFYVHVSSQWVPAQAYVHDGAAWQPATPHVLKDGAWVPP